MLWSAIHEKFPTAWLSIGLGSKWLGEETVEYKMASNIIPNKTPEERELAAKNAALAALKIQLAQRELELATLRGELHVFEQQYLRLVGVKFAEIDDLEAQIAEALNRQHPSDETVRQGAADARRKATESAGAAGAADQATHVVGFTPSEDLKRLYREIAKRVHPDLATDAAERAKRNQVMADVNRAYADGDEARLRAILNQWETSPDAVTGDGVGAELVRTIRKIHQVEERLAAIAIEIATLNGSELSLLKARTESERMNGRDTLAEMAEQLERQLILLRERRNDIRSSEASL